jgi:hypothetical protein
LKGALDEPIIGLITASEYCGALRLSAEGLLDFGRHVISYDQELLLTSLTADTGVVAAADQWDSSGPIVLSAWGEPLAALAIGRALRRRWSFTLNRVTRWDSDPRTSR